MTTTKSSKTAQGPSATWVQPCPSGDIEKLQEKLAALTLKLRSTQQDLLDAEDELESSQADLSTALSSLAERGLELENTKVALANSEHARLNSERACQEANSDRVLSRPHRKQEVFVVLKFRNPQPLPIGGYRFFALQRKAVDHTLNHFIAENPELDAVEVDELRFDRSPRGENVYQQMKDDKAAPIEFSRRNFILKKGKCEGEMIAYVQQVFNTHIQETQIQ
ncbi:hypothetical protein BGZ46_007989 [Entomortierella lignicola]|nr:hypothetical protein BGZ46_007989 [Entomortierella lignicola]